MYKIFTCIGICFLALNASAQISVTNDYVDVVNQPKDAAIHKGYDSVYNGAKNKDSITWQVIYNYSPQGWSNVGICDNVACYQVSDNSVHKATIPAESYMQIYTDVKADTNAVSGCDIIRISITGGGLVNKVVTFSHTDLPSATNCHVLAIGDVSPLASIHTSPNPFTTGFNLTINDYTSAYVAIFDIFGKKIATQSVIKGMNYIDMQEKSAGIYIVKVYNQQNKAAYTAKLIKK